MDDTDPHPLNIPQISRSTFRVGDKFVMEAEVRVTPLGLFAIAGLVTGILLAVPPIIRAGQRAARALPPPRD